MYKHQLATLYFPLANKKTALRRLERWIIINKDLTLALGSTGYNKNQNILTNAQVLLFFKYLGEP